MALPIVVNDSGNAPVQGGLSVWGQLGTTGSALSPGARWMGAVAGAAPTVGTFSVGDWVIDYVTPAILVCTVAGTPGTWQPV